MLPPPRTVRNKKRHAVLPPAPATLPGVRAHFSPFFGLVQIGFGQGKTLQGKASNSS
jgi:hypothetical protein